MTILDSRRLTGPSLLLDRPGAILDVSFDGIDGARAVAAWRDALARLAADVGWSDLGATARAWRGTPPAAAAPVAGASLAFAAPFDALYAATELNEAAWFAAVRALGADAAGIAWTHLPEDAPYADRDPARHAHAAVAAWLRARIAGESRPVQVALAAAARAHGVTMLADDQRVSLGLGVGSRSWPSDALPDDPGAVPWGELRDIPLALVTGTNGKTTTVRLLGAIARAAGVTAGITSTDRVTVGDEVVAEGDYSGPNGARTVLRDRRVEVAMLELARGGILRRGLAVPRARVALVTNVDDDHLGEFGIFDVPALADVKLVVAKAVEPGGRVVLNADDPLLVERGRALAAPVLWFTLDHAHPRVRAHHDAGGDACWVEDGILVLGTAGARHPIAPIDDIPIALRGAARHNMANALAAAGVAHALGFPLAAIGRGLTALRSTPADNPGRANLWTFGGVQVLVDFAHNPHGMRALAEVTRSLGASRRGVVIGQAGDRDDEAIRAFARAAAAIRPERVFVKEMEVYLRGRAPGVVPAIIESEFRAAGWRADQLERHAGEYEAVRAALAWARAGDALLVTTHAERDRVIGLMERLAERAWTPGQALVPAEA